MRPISALRLMNYVKNIIQHERKGTYSLVKREITPSMSYGKYTAHSRLQPHLPSMYNKILLHLDKQQESSTSDLPLKDRVIKQTFREEKSTRVAESRVPTKTRPHSEGQGEDSFLRRHNALYTSLKNYMNQRFPQPIGEEGIEQTSSPQIEQETESKAMPKSLSENPTLWANRNALQTELERIMKKS